MSASDRGAADLGVLDDSCSVCRSQPTISAIDPPPAITMGDLVHDRTPSVPLTRTSGANLFAVFLSMI
jgi:hypothetical protein